MSATSNRPQLEFQPRDVRVLLGLFESRILTLKHVAALYFDGRQEAAKKRLQRLKLARVVAERPRRPYEPGVLFLTKRGLSHLRRTGCLGAYPDLPWAALQKRARVSSMTVAHELDVMSVKAAFVSAVRGRPELELVQFQTWSKLFQFRARHLSRSGEGGRPLVTIRPDGFIRLRAFSQSGGLIDHYFFLEVDRSTETQQTLIRRSGCYVDYYRTSGFAQRIGGANARRNDFPFRVLFVFKTVERLRNTAAALLACVPPILTQVWLTTLQEVKVEPLGPIWMRPADSLHSKGFKQFLLTPASRLHAVRSRRTDHDREAA